MLNHYQRRHSFLSEINVVPYIDVMLVLLVIFMITTPLLTQGVQVNLPKAVAQAIASGENLPIVVSVDKAGKYFLNIDEEPDVAMTAKQIALRIAAEIQIAGESDKPMPAILIKGDRNVAYGKVVEAMVILQKAGVKQLGLMTDNKLG